MTTTTHDLPEEWFEGAEMLDGLELVDKATLVGVPFLITTIGFRETQGQDGAAISFVEVDAVNREGETFCFQDSSTTGVRQMLVDYLATIHRDDIVESGERLNIRLVIPKGLRRSEYDRKLPSGKTVKAQTYYLTRSGRRETPAETPADAEATQKPARRRTRAETGAKTG